MPHKIGPRRPFRHFIVEHRESKGLTQEQLADRIGCDAMTVSRWENYKVRIDFNILAAVAEALYGDMAEPEDMLHHPEEPTADQLLRQLPEDDQQHFMKQIKRAANQG
jgi:transcriptional regulator with XRE-family HTH domain